jgi:hypothetical protein
MVYLFSLKSDDVRDVQENIRSNLYYLNELMTLAEKLGNKELQSKIKADFELYYGKFMAI